MDVLVTGGAGFLGSHLVDRLVANGQRVTVLDNFCSGSAENLMHLEGSSQCGMICADVAEPFDVAAQQIFNLACPASPRHYQSDPVATLRTNFLGALNALNLAHRQKARVFQASTSEVYGDALMHPQKESYWGNVNPIGIRSCYDEGKRAAEALFFDHHRQFGTDIRVARIFNTYGPRMLQNDGRVVSNFIVQALRGEDITIYGRGTQTRSFCYVDDMIDAFIALMDAPDPQIGPFNLGNTEEVTILELAQTILDMTGSKSGMTFVPLPHDDPKARQPDTTAAREALGWQPKMALREGLSLTIDYFDTVLSRQQRKTGI